MDIKKFFSSKGNLWLILAAAAGLLLLFFSAGREGTATAAQENTPEAFELCEERLEERLVALLSEMEGVSDVSVMLTLEDVPKSNQRPRVRGVAIVCRGCEDSNVKLRIVMLASGALGIASDKIFVSPA